MASFQYSSDVENEVQNGVPSPNPSHSPRQKQTRLTSASKLQNRKIEQLKEELQIAAEIGKNLLLSEAEKGRKIEVLQDQVAQLRSKNTELQRLWAEEKDGLNTELAEFKEECGQLKQRNSQLALRMEAAMKDSQEMQDEHLRSVTKAKASESELQNLKKRLVYVQSSAQRPTEGPSYQASPVTPPFNVKRDLFRSRNTPDGQLNTPMSGSTHNGGTPQERMISKLQEELDAIKSRNKTYSSTVVKLHNKLADLETRNLDSTKKLKAAEQEIGEYRRIKEAHSELLGSYKTQLNTKTDLSTAEGASLAASLLKQELTDTKAELKSCTAELEQARQDTACLKEQIRGLLYPKNANPHGTWLLYLERKRKSKAWKTRYCRVRDGVLETFHNEWDKRPSSRLQLNGFELRVCRRRPRSSIGQAHVLENAIELYLWSRNKSAIRLRCKDVKNFYSWVEHLRESREMFVAGYVTVDDKLLFAVVKREEILFYKSPQSTKSVLHLPLTQAFTIAMDIKEPTRFAVVYTNIQSRYSIQARTESDCRWWIEAIMSVKSDKLNWDATLKRIVDDY